jgi:hypothetical protein
MPEFWKLFDSPLYMRVHENMELRRILGPEKKKLTGGWRKMHSEKLLNFTPCQILLG